MGNESMSARHERIKLIWPPVATNRRATSVWPERHYRCRAHLVKTPPEYSPLLFEITGQWRRGKCCQVKRGVGLGGTGGVGGETDSP